MVLDLWVHVKVLVQSASSASRRQRLVLGKQLSQLIVGCMVWNLFLDVNCRGSSCQWQNSLSNRLNWCPTMCIVIGKEFVCWQWLLSWDSSFVIVLTSRACLHFENSERCNKWIGLFCPTLHVEARQASCQEGASTDSVLVRTSLPYKTLPALWRCNRWSPNPRTCWVLILQPRRNTFGRQIQLLRQKFNVNDGELRRSPAMTPCLFTCWMDQNSPPVCYPTALHVT